MRRLAGHISQRQRRHLRVRAKIFGTPARPRLNVFRSSKHIYAQIIDDTCGKVLFAISDLGLKTSGIKSEKSAAVGKVLAEEALKRRINKVAFDRGGYQFTGRVKALAEAARQSGLQF